MFCFIKCDIFSLIINPLDKKKNPNERKSDGERV